MKTGWLKSPRKERLEQVAMRMREMTYSQSAIAWQKLANKLLEMGEPDAANPRFNELLLAVVSASQRADQRATGIEWPPAIQTETLSPGDCVDLFKPAATLCGDQL